MRLGFLCHPIDFVFAQAAGTGNRDFLLATCTEVFRTDMKNAVRIDVERHFDLRNAAWRRRDTIEMEDAELLVIARKRPLALEHLNLHARLIVTVSRKD